jgi:CRISPR-associated protein Cas5t
MYVFSVEGVALTASFRIPENHTFHQTLPLPPKTTLLGMIGAGCGFTLEHAHRFAEENQVIAGVSGKNGGMMKDLWNYRKIGRDDATLSLDQIRNREHYSVLIREYLCFLNIRVSFGAPNKGVVEDIRQGFLSPRYALTAGNSDDLFKVKRVSPLSSGVSCSCMKLENTIVAGDVSTAYRPDIDLKSMRITETITAPQVFLLPTRFSFQGNERRVSERGLFTFIGSPVTLSEPVLGFLVDGKETVLL